MSTIDLNRRGLFKAGAVIAAASTISSIPVVAQAAEEPEKKIRPLTGKNLKMKDVLDRAREMMMPRCYVCAECNAAPASARCQASAAWARTVPSRRITMRLLQSV